MLPSLLHSFRATESIAPHNEVVKKHLKMTDTRSFAAVSTLMYSG
jgi:hypothetical protein